jgi:AcrR family transcriptional regulator
MSSATDDQNVAGELPSLIDLLPRRRTPRPRARQTSLSREQIIRAAIELADADGPDAISMRRIAARLGVGAMTLYGHVADRDALIAHMINEVAAEMEMPARPSGNWRADLELVARSLRDTCRRHRWLPAELGTLPFLIAPLLLAPAELVLAALEPSGIDLQTAGAMLRLLNNYVIGTTLREAADPLAPATSSPPGYQQAMGAYLRQVGASGHYPLMSRLGLSVLDGTVLTADQSFEAGLQCLLDGISALVAQRAGSGPTGPGEKADLASSNALQGRHGGRNHRTRSP